MDMERDVAWTWRRHPHAPAAEVDGLKSELQQLQASLNALQNDLVAARNAKDAADEERRQTIADATARRQVGFLERMCIAL